MWSFIWSEYDTPVNSGPNKPNKIINITPTKPAIASLFFFSRLHAPPNMSDLGELPHYPAHRYLQRRILLLSIFTHINHSPL